MFWKSVPFPHFLFYFFPEQKSTEAFSSFPQTKEFLCEKEKTNRCCCFPPGTFMGKRRRHLPKSPIWESAVGVGWKKILPLSLLGASSGAIEKFLLCWFFAWKIWENGDTIFSPFSPRDDVYTIETDAAAGEKTSFSHAKRAKVDDPQFPSQPQNSEEKCVSNFERQKPMCSLPSLESDPTTKKKIAVHTSCTTHPSFPPFRQRKL